MATKRIDFSEDNEDICDSIIEIFRGFPEGAELYVLQNALPDVSPTSLGNALNSLLNAGKIDLCKSESKGLKYKLKSSMSSSIKNDQEKNVASSSHGAKKRRLHSSSQMEIFAKNIQMGPLKTVRDDLFCQCCEKFPRPGTALVRCTSIRSCIICEGCRPTSTNREYIEQPELTKLLSAFGTHPCTYLKNGCHEEIIANMDTLEAHDLSCIFQKVPCPKLNCDENIIFKDVDKHLKKCHSDILLIYIANETPRMMKYNGYGIYNLQSEPMVNGRKYYSSGKFGIWSNIERKKWFLGLIQDLGKSKSIAYLCDDIEIPDSTTNGKWFLRSAHKDDDWEISVDGVVLKGILKFINENTF